MAKKKLDPRIRRLIEQGVETGHRSIFMIMGDYGRDQVVHLHYILSKARVSARPNVLWCYKKELGFSSHRLKRIKLLAKQKEKGLLDKDKVKDRVFDQFLTTTEIRYCYYKETENILGTTFGMCVLQDFEALTPNILARTIETVQGGGIIVFLLKTMTSLKQLYTMTMDVHARYRTESHQDEIISRFNERFLLSLCSCPSCLIVDDELNVLPVSTHSRQMLEESRPLACTDAFKELELVRGEYKTTVPLGKLLELAKTVDQARTVASLVQTLETRTTGKIVSLTASRGRGKSAAMGMAASAAVSLGYSNVFVTCPQPSNLKTFFELVVLGLNSMGYKEHLDYAIVRSSNLDNPAFVVKIQIFKTHRQTIQYIDPKQGGNVLFNAELVIVDEAAAVPLPIIKRLFGPHLTFLASTINGYEGTGRSLSLKLVQQLKNPSLGHHNEFGQEILEELKLEEPIRYREGDLVEKWMNELLCLDTTIVKGIDLCPHPSQCELYHVNRDTLFSYHKASEAFLQKIIGLCVSSHYKNTPNDIQLLSDAPAHHLFVLLPKVDESCAKLPEVLAVIQIGLEGQISKTSVMKSLSRGIQSGGDLIPWTISQQFQDVEFASLSGARIIRIATHPDYQNMGYGTRAIQLLEEYYRNGTKHQTSDPAVVEPADWSEGAVAPRKNLSPLLTRLEERSAEKIDWIGVSFGLSEQLFRFWRRQDYVPVYIRQTINQVTGEHTIVMVKQQLLLGPNWLELFYNDFRRRFLVLSQSVFRDFSARLSLEIQSARTCPSSLTWGEIQMSLSVYDLKRLESYANNMVDHHLVADLISTMAAHYFGGRFGEALISPVQSCMLFAFGIQRKSVEEVGKELRLEVSQVLAILVKIVKKLFRIYRKCQEEHAELELDPTSTRDNVSSNEWNKIASVSIGDTVSVRRSGDYTRAPNTLALLKEKYRRAEARKLEKSMAKATR